MLGELPKAETKERPAINSTFIPTSDDIGEPRSLTLDRLVYWVKRTPECIGILKRIATDIVTDFHFVSIESQKKSKMGRPAKKPNLTREDRVMAFTRKNFFRQKLIAAVIDWLMTGDAYIWKGRLSENQIKEITSKVYQSYGLEVKEFFDEDFNNVNAIEVITSSMVEITHTETVITNYIQKSKVSPADNRKYKPEEVIHAKFMDIDGKVYGFSPMESSYIAILTINAIQDYGYNYFANGVKLDRAWLFSGNPNQSYIDKFEENLGSYKKVKDAHGDLIVAGADNITTEKLNEANEEMEYRQLAIHSVGRLAFAFNMPADILSSILGVDVKGTAVGSDIEDAGYNRNIEMSQQYWEELLNNQLFVPEFKAEIRFERTFRQDQIRKIQYLAMATPVVEFFMKHEYPISDEFYHDFLQIDRKYLTPGEIKKEIEEMPMPGQLPGKPAKGENQQAQSDAKKNQQKPQQNINKPIGS